MDDAKREKVWASFFFLPIVIPMNDGHSSFFFFFCGTRYAHWSERFNRVGLIILATIWLDKIHAQHWTYLILLKIVQADHFGWNGGRIHSLKTFAILPPVCSSKVRMCTKMSQESLPPLLAIFFRYKGQVQPMLKPSDLQMPPQKTSLLKALSTFAEMFLNWELFLRA